MSGLATGWALGQDGLDPHAKLVLVVLADASNPDNDFTCWQKQATLATRSGLARSTVQRKLDLLSESGLITIEERRREDGGKTSNLYRLHLEVTIGRPLPDQVKRPLPDTEATPASSGEASRTVREPEEEPEGEPEARKRARALCDWLRDLHEEDRGGYSKTELAAATWLVDKVVDVELSTAVRWAQGRTYWAPRTRTAVKLKRAWKDLRVEWRAARSKGSNGRSVGRSGEDLRRMADELREAGQ